MSCMRDEEATEERRRRRRRVESEKQNPPTVMWGKIIGPDNSACTQFNKTQMQDRKRNREEKDI